MIPGFNEKEWPFEVQIDNPDGSMEQSTYAKENGDGTVSFISWGDRGPVVKTVTNELTTLRERLGDLESKWHERFREIFGFDLRK